jgi:hypothetical protein
VKSFLRKKYASRSTLRLVEKLARDAARRTKLPAMPRPLHGDEISHAADTLRFYWNAHY